jgi:hypothetical protein
MIVPIFSWMFEQRADAVLPHGFIKHAWRHADHEHLRSQVGVPLLMASGGIRLHGFYLKLVVMVIAATFVRWCARPSNLRLANGEIKTV